MFEEVRVRSPSMARSGASCMPDVAITLFVIVPQKGLKLYVLTIYLSASCFLTKHTTSVLVHDSA